MRKTTNKKPILQRTALVIAMSAVSFPSYALSSTDNNDTYQSTDEGSVIIGNRDRSTRNEGWINTNDPFIQELRDLRDNPPTPPPVPPGPDVPDPNAPPPSSGSPGDLTEAPRTKRKCSETIENEIREIEYGKLGVDIAALALEASGEAIQALPFGAGAGGSILVVSSLATQAVNAALGFVVLEKDAQAADAPSCGQEFVGDVEVTEGANVVVSDYAGNRTISLGPDGNGNLQPGVAIGGGQITGAGDGNLATASNRTAIAIGNNAKATAVNSTAIGETAEASGLNSSSYGAQSQATNDNSTAIGRDAQATQKNATATGASSRAIGESSTAIGQGALANKLNTTATGVRFCGPEHR